MRHHPIALLIAFAVGSASAAEYTAHVIGISEGDTLTVLRDGRTQVKIRLHGVNAPETRPRPK
jgi:endonuclease YncB( thermonuclease family)